MLADRIQELARGPADVLARALEEFSRAEVVGALGALPPADAVVVVRVGRIHEALAETLLRAPDDASDLIEAALHPSNCAAVAKALLSPKLKSTPYTIDCSGEPVFLPLHVRRLNARKLGDREMAVRAMCEVGTPEVVPHLEAYLVREMEEQTGEGQRSNRGSTVSFTHLSPLLCCLHDLGRPPSAETIRALMEAPVHALGTEAMEYVRERNRQDLLDLARAGLKHKGDNARHAARLALLDVGGAQGTFEIAEIAIRTAPRPMSEHDFSLLAERGTVDLIEFLDPPKHALLILKLEVVAFHHGISSADRVCGRVALIEADLLRAPSDKLGENRSCWGTLLRTLAQIGETERAKDLAAEIDAHFEERLGPWSPSEAARNMVDGFPDPRWLRRLEPYDIERRARCGDDAARAELERRLLTAGTDEYCRPHLLEFAAAGSRVETWTRMLELTPRTDIPGRERLVTWTAGKVDFRAALERVASDPEEFAAVRRAASRALSASPPGPPRIVRWTAEQIQKLRTLRARAARGR